MANTAMTAYRKVLPSVQGGEACCVRMVDMVILRVAFVVLSKFLTLEFPERKRIKGSVVAVAANAAAHRGEMSGSFAVGGWKRHRRYCAVSRTKGDWRGRAAWGAVKRFGRYAAARDRREAALQSHSVRIVECNAFVI